MLCRRPNDEEKTMTPQRNHTTAERQATIQEMLREKMRLAIRHTLNNMGR